MRPPQNPTEAYSMLKKTLYAQLEDEIYYYSPLHESQPNYRFLGRQHSRLLVKQLLLWSACAVVLLTQNIHSLLTLALMVHK